MKKKGFIYRLLYGKESKDFTEENLPKNRQEVLKGLLKNHYRQIILISLLCFLFFLPMISFYMLKDIYIAYGEVIYPEGLQMSKEQYLIIRSFSLNTAAYIIGIVGMMLGFLGLSGAFYVIRRYVFAQGVLFKTDFLVGIKKSFKSYLFFGFLFGLSLFVLQFNLGFYSIDTPIPSLVKMTFLFLAITQFIIVLIATMFGLSALAIYELRVKDAIKYAFYLTFKKLFKNILVFTSLMILIIAMFLVGDFYLTIVGSIILAVFGFGLLISMITLYTHSIFDVYINEKNYPELVSKGMYKKVS